MFDRYRYYGQEETLSESVVNDINEQLLVQECSTFSEEQLKMFLESDLCKSLCEAGKFSKRSIMLLSKQDDLTKREKLICLNLAREAKDPDWEKLKKNRIQERKLIANIVKRYRSKASKAAKIQQKDWIKNRMPANFGKFGGADR